MIMPLNSPMIDPVSFAPVVPIPRVKRPNKGPPTTPKIVRELKQQKLLLDKNKNYKRNNFFTK